MPLEPCRECATPVSTDARACPKCGAASPTDTDGQVATGRAFRVIFIIIAVIALLLWMTVSGWFG